MSLLSFLRPAGPVPPEYRHNFRHLYMDVAWYGVLSVSALAFVGVYLARQGGSAFQVGLLTAGPAVANLLVAIPIGHWLQRRAIGRAVFWSSIANRLFYVFWIPLPFLLAPSAQVWTLIGLTIAMSVPGAGLVIGFNTLFAEAVPPTWRGHVAGIRNALLAVTSVVGSLVCGYILTAMVFPVGYQVVFAIGTIAAFMSSLHLWFVRPPDRRGTPARPAPPAPVVDVRIDQVRAADTRPATPARSLLHAPALSLQRTEILSGPFGKVLLALFIFHITQYLTVPVIPVYMVRELHLQDEQIGLATAAFWVFSFGASLLLARLTEHKGHRWVTAIGAMLMAGYPGFMALSGGFGMATVLLACLVGGIGYALMSGAFLNYILERVPHGDRPPYLAWYNIVFNAAILIGALLGPFAAGRMGFAVALGLFAAGRVAAGLFILTRG